MIYTVVWVPDALDELTSLWLIAADRAAVTDASNRIYQCVVRVSRRSSGLAARLRYKEGTLDEVDGLQLPHRFREAIEAIAEDM
jgi:hypothetical protein